MMTETKPPLDGLNDEALAGPVRRMLVDAAAELVDWRHEPLAYTVRNPLAGGVFRVTGHARTRGEVRPWSLILKIAHSPAGRSWPDGRVAPPGWGMNPAHSQYWKREALAYRSGLLDNLPGGLVAPRCFGVDERGDDVIWLWLEEMRESARRPWPLARYGLAARHLGRFNGAYRAGRPLPTAPWLNRGFLCAWTADPARVTLTETIVSAETWAHPLVRAAFPIPVADRLRRLHSEREPCSPRWNGSRKRSATSTPFPATCSPTRTRRVSSKQSPSIGPSWASRQSVRRSATSSRGACY